MSFLNQVPFVLFPSMLFFVQNKAMLSTSRHCTVFSNKGTELLRWPIKTLGCDCERSPLLSRLSFEGRLPSFRIWLFRFWENTFLQPLPIQCCTTTTNPDSWFVKGHDRITQKRQHGILNFDQIWFDDGKEATMASSRVDHGTMHFSGVKIYFDLNH